MLEAPNIAEPLCRSSEIFRYFAAGGVPVSKFRLRNSSDHDNAPNPSWSAPVATPVSFPALFGRPNITGRLSYLASDDSRGQGYAGGALYTQFLSKKCEHNMTTTQKIKSLPILRLTLLGHRLCIRMVWPKSESMPYSA